jgi:hypothetical protein
MGTLISGLNDYRRQVGQEFWVGSAIPACRTHPLHGLLLQDPYTHRAFHKPRGYAGDAIMLDFIYQGVTPDGTTALGQAIFKETTSSSNARSVLARRDLLARRIDEVAESVDRPAILSIACGHLREAQRARSVCQGVRGAFFALDQDAESLATVAREQSGNRVQTVHSSVAALLRGELPVPPLHFVYAAGLFDYLSDALAERLAARMFQMLAPGHSLLIGNFAPDNPGPGYLEAFMDWQLVYRDEQQMENLARRIPGAAIASRSVFRDPYQNVVYLELTRRCDHPARGQSFLLA